MNILIHQKYAHRISELKEQNAALLEALKQVKMDIEFESLGLGDLKKQIKQAIAKAEAE